MPTTETRVRVDDWTEVTVTVTDNTGRVVGYTVARVPNTGTPAAQVAANRAANTASLTDMLAALAAIADGTTTLTLEDQAVAAARVGLLQQRFATDDHTGRD